MRERCIALAVLAYPPAFRRDFGPELHAIFEATTGRGRVLRFAPRASRFFRSIDAVATGIGERVRLGGGTMGLARPAIAAAGMSQESIDELSNRCWPMCSLAFRQFRRAPLFALVTARRWPLGIGANSAIFGVVYSVLLAAVAVRRSRTRW